MTMKHTPTPWKISDIDPITGQDDMSIEFEGCPICTVRGTNDMSCIDEEDEPKIREECLGNAQLIIEAVNNHHALELQVKELKDTLLAIIQKREEAQSTQDLFEVLREIEKAKDHFIPEHPEKL